MEEEKQSEEEKVIDLKGTLAEFVKEDMPELSQEEAIKAYRTDDTIRPLKKNEEDEDAENSDEEHLKRIKKELLESLARVEELAKKLFDEKDKTKENLKSIKVKKSSGSGGKGKSNQEQVLNQMRQKIEENAERSREE